MRRVDGAGAGFLFGETPGWHMHVSALMILDPREASHFSFETVRKGYGRRLAGAPALKSRLVGAPLGLDRPVLVDDPAFDLDAHFHRAHLPAPGNRRQLTELAASLVARKLDRSRPLWEAWWIDGLDDGRVALVVKIHHALMDGVSGVDLAGLIMDLEPDPPRDAPAPRPAPGAAPESAPSAVELGLGSLRALAALPWRSARFANQLARQTATFARHLRSPEPPPRAFAAPRTRFNRSIGINRSLAVTTIPMADVLTVKQAFGVTVNDVVLTLCGGALRGYLADQGELPGASLIAQVPVSVRTAASRDDVGSQVANMFTTLATDVADAVERLRVIQSVTARAKRYQHEIFADRSVAIPDVAPPVVIGAAARLFTGLGLERVIPPVYNLVVSDVRGSPVDLYVVGARVEAIYPLGPLLMGAALNVTALSNKDGMDLGFLATPEALPDPWELVERTETELATLVGAARAEA
ncbi:MAG TPA: wax ester/triacylglycerol synthase family O-acyltransferase [Acidimicrobiia bacterium]|nr:wax ester/triacylglycerol synthase family O-acyltransferase [Acidimicrobiia bacterium]